MAVFGYRKLLSRVAVGLVACTVLAGCLPEDKPADPNAGYEVAVVDFNELAKLHPSSEKFVQINQKIAELEEKKVTLAKKAREDAIKGGSVKMDKAVTEAKAKLEAEKAQIQKELSGLSAALSAQISREMSGLQAASQAELNGIIERYKREAGVAPKPITPDVDGQVKDYLANLSLVRERNLAAKRLELEKQVGDRVAAKKAEVDGQIASYEAGLSAQYQSERLNLQLQAQNTSDEEAQKAAGDRLAAIAQEIASLKAQKAAELQGGLNAVTSEETAALQGKLAAYQATLDAEVKQKLDAKRAELGGRVPQAAPQNDPRPEIEAKIAQIKSRMAGELAAKKARLQQQMEAKMAEATARLQKKQKEVEASLKALEKQIEEDVNKALTEGDPEVKKQIDAITADIETHKKEANSLYEQITKDVNTQVGKVAEKKEVEMVIGQYEYKDPSYLDLTDFSRVSVQQMESK